MRKPGWGLWEQSPLSPQVSVNLEQSPKAKLSRQEAQVSGQKNGLRSQSAFLPKQPHIGPAEQCGCSTLPDPQRRGWHWTLFQLSFVYEEAKWGAREEVRLSTWSNLLREKSVCRGKSRHWETAKDTQVVGAEEKMPPPYLLPLSMEALPVDSLCAQTLDYPIDTNSECPHIPDIVPLMFPSAAINKTLLTVIWKVCLNCTLILSMKKKKNLN